MTMDNKYNLSVTYMSGRENKQHSPGRYQHLGLRKVANGLLLHLCHMTYQRLYVLGPVLVAPAVGEFLQTILKRLLQGATTAEMCNRFRLT